MQKKDSEQNWCLQGAPLSAKLRSPLAKRQTRGVKHAAAFVCLLTLVPYLGLEVMPATELLSVHPYLREEGHGTPIHGAGDTLVICQRGSLVGTRFERVAVGHPTFHETRPPLGKAYHSSVVAVGVGRDHLLPTLLVSERHLLGSDRKSSLEY